MTNRVAIIGSFQKYYDDVIKIIRLFRKKGLWVLSPKDSHITDKIEDFVIFESDNKQYSPEEIQMVTLERILNSDAVYVYNPDGYVGRTTCYEIGFCFSREIPLYYYNKPQDLPIPINQEQILTPEVFIKTILFGKYGFVKEYDLCDDAKKSLNNIMNISTDDSYPANKNIVICGSMMFYQDMLECQRVLQEHKINSIIPKDENEIINTFNEEDFRYFKRKVSNAYLRKIRNKNTVAVLIYNETKKGVKNYIGANTLVELAMAFTWNRKIFLYDDIYEPLADELLAWDCICLNRDLNGLINSLKEIIEPQGIPQSIQLSLFDKE